MSISKVLFEDRHFCLCIIYVFFHNPMAELCCNRNHMVHRAKIMYYLSFTEKKISDLCCKLSTWEKKCECNWGWTFSELKEHSLSNFEIKLCGFNKLYEWSKLSSYVSFGTWRNNTFPILEIKPLWACIPEYCGSYIKHYIG